MVNEVNSLSIVKVIVIRSQPFPQLLLTQPAIFVHIPADNITCTWSGMTINLERDIIIHMLCCATGPKHCSANKGPLTIMSLVIKCDLEL